MKYTIRYSCGHDVTVNLEGTEDKIVRMIKWLEKYGRCPSCKELLKASEIARINNAAAREAREENLPELNGTEKQKIWAVTIRHRILKDAKKLINEKKDNKSSIEFYNWLKQQTNTEKWIKNRNKNIEEIYDYWHEANEKNKK